MAQKLKCWVKKETEHPLIRTEASSDEYMHKDGSYVRITNIRMDTSTPYWVVSSDFPLEEFKTIPQARKFAKSYMKNHDRC